MSARSSSAVPGVPFSRVATTEVARRPVRTRRPEPARDSRIGGRGARQGQAELGMAMNAAAEPDGVVLQKLLGLAEQVGVPWVSRVGCGVVGARTLR